MNSGGSHRPYRLVKHLKNLGINPIVVTPEVDDMPIDKSLYSGIEDIHIVRTAIKKPTSVEKLLSKQYINILESESRRWKKYLYQAVKDLVLKYHFKAMYVTAPPFSIADLGVEISKSFKLPLILDMRDSWSYWNITPFASYLALSINFKKRKTVVHTCSCHYCYSQTIS